MRPPRGRGGGRPDRVEGEGSASCVGAEDEGKAGRLSEDKDEGTAARTMETRTRARARGGEKGKVGWAHGRGGGVAEWRIRCSEEERRREDTRIYRVGTL
jgi:hypothetical protein